MRLACRCILCVVITAVSSSSAVAGGDLLINWNADYGDWTKGVGTGELPGNWYAASANGRVFLKDLPAERAMTTPKGIDPTTYAASGKTINNIQRLSINASSRAA